MPAAKSGGDSRNTLYCSFCGKSQHEVRKLIAGPTVFICDECVELCMDILRDDLPGEESKAVDRSGKAPHEEQASELTGDAAPLEAAVTAYRAALEERTWDRDALGWAETQSN